MLPRAYVFKTKLIYTMYPKMNEMYMQGVMDKILIEWKVFVHAAAGYNTNLKCI